MDSNSYKFVKQNWQYVPPGMKGLVFLDYHFEKGLELFESQLKIIFKKKNIFYLLPRIAGIAFVIFISIFALDVFTDSKSLETLLQGLLMHLIPSFILLTMLVVAWRYERFGGFIYVLAFLVIFSLIIVRKPLVTDLIIYGPLLIIGSLFLIDSYIRNQRN